MDTIMNYVDSTFFRSKKEERPILPMITAATVLLFTVYKLHTGYQKYEKKMKRDLKEIPVPDSAWPYFGHMLSLGKVPSKKIVEWHGKLGPIIQLHMGVHRWVSVDDPALAHKIFVTHGVDTSYRPHSAFAYHHYSLEGKGIGFSQPNAGWREARSAVVSVLAPKQIEKYMDSIHDKANKLVSQLITSTQEEGSVDPRMNLELYSLNVVSSACFGKTYESIHDPDFIKLAHLIVKSMGLAGLENDIPNFLPAFAIFDYFAGTQEKMKTFVQTQRDPICKKLIEFAKRQEEPNIVKSFEENGFVLEEENLIVMMFDLIGGGTDTISLTLLWNIAIMSNYLEEQRKAAAEIDAFIQLNGRLPNFNERTQVPYCISFIKECMRFKPTTAFGIPHAVYNDVEVEGYVIPKGATLITSMESLHKNPNIYPNPERFYPERFSHHLRTMQASANGKLEERDHFNFGWGRRICPAIYLAEVEVFSTFVRMLAECFVEPIEEEMPDLENPQAAGVNLIPIPYKVKFTRRTDSYLSPLL